jgi:hypothetical protein
LNGDDRTWFERALENQPHPSPGHVVKKSAVGLKAGTDQEAHNRPPDAMVARQGAAVCDFEAYLGLRTWHDVGKDHFVVLLFTIPSLDENTRATLRPARQ